MFDARAFVEAMEVPTFVDLDGKKWVGRLMSAPDHARHHAAFDALIKNPAEGFLASQALLQTVAESMFPPEAVVALMRLPGVALEAAFMDFFDCHLRAAVRAREVAPPPVPLTLVKEEPAPTLEAATPRTVGS